jgi:hypothetical protein
MIFATDLLDLFLNLTKKELNNTIAYDRIICSLFSVPSQKAIDHFKELRT